MKRLLALLLFLPAAALSALPTREEAMTAISTLEKNLLSEDAIDASKVMLEYARDSEDVIFSVGPDTVPWVTDERSDNDGDDAIHSLLLAVYLAGNAKSQLEQNKTEDDPYAGWVAVIRGYRQLQTKNRFVIQSLEELSEMQEKGTLRDHARAVKERERKADLQEEAALARRDSI